MPYLSASPPGPPARGRGENEEEEAPGDPGRGRRAPAPGPSGRCRGHSTPDPPAGAGGESQLRERPRQRPGNSPRPATPGAPRQDGEAPRIPTLHSQHFTLIFYLLSPLSSLHTRIQADRSGKRLGRFPLLQSIYNPSRPVSRSAGRRWDSRPPLSWRAGSRRRCRCRRRRRRRSPPPPRWG